MIETGDFSNRIVSAELMEEDTAIEKGLRPLSLAEYIGQDKVKENMEFTLKQPNVVKGLLTMCCSMDRRDWARRRSLRSLQRRWVSICASPQVLLLNGQVILQPS